MQTKTQAMDLEYSYARHKRAKLGAVITIVLVVAGVITLSNNTNGSETAMSLKQAESVETQQKWVSSDEAGVSLFSKFSRTQVENATNKGDLWLGFGRSPTFFRSNMLFIGAVQALVQVGGTSGHGMVYLMEPNGGTGFWEVRKAFSPPFGPHHGGGFGHNMAASGDTVVIGENIAPAGQVHVYEYNGMDFNRVQSVAPPSGFGSSFATDEGLSLVGNTMLVGGPGHDSQKGSAFVYHRKGAGSAWTLVQTFLNEDVTPRYQFGHATAIGGAKNETLFIAQWYTNLVCVYNWNGVKYERTQMLSGSALGLPSNSYLFGKTIATQGDILAVGAIGEPAVYLYRLNPSSKLWTFHQRVAGPAFLDFRGNTIVGTTWGGGPMYLYGRKENGQFEVMQNVTGLPLVSPALDEHWLVAGDWRQNKAYFYHRCGPRVRKEWHSLSNAERARYLNGFRQLRVSGKLEIFTKEHIEAARSGFDGLTFHGNDGFLPWHRYFIWELEEQIRGLGGEYKCFTLPYWDWTRGAGQTVANNPLWDTTTIGGNGGGGNGCVVNGLVSEGSGYVVSQVSGGGCLTRGFSGGTNSYQTTAQLMLMVETTSTYTSFRQQLEGSHNSAHVSVGGFLTDVYRAPDDPVFFLLHSYVDMIWALRSDCHDYNEASSVNNNIFPTNLMSAKMSYPELAKANWAYIHSKSISVSSLLRTTDDRWSYTYDGSNMRARSGMEMAGCSWKEIPAMEERSVEVPSDGLVTIADLVDLDVQLEKAKQEMSDADIAAYACKRMQELEVELGYKSDVCKYTEELEKCGPGSDRMVISLNALLNRKGVRRNACIIAARKALYNFTAETGTLRSLCNGLMDPVCPPIGKGVAV